VIESQSQLDDWAERVAAAPWAALDTEADSLYSYPEKLCLLQISIPGVDKLVDPLCQLNLQPLATVLKPKPIIVHGGDFDLRLLRRNLNFVPSAVFDTMLAARFLGLQEFSLTRLTEQCLGIRLEKGPQKADWGRRPLTQRMEDYARNDTRFLKPLSDILAEKLRAHGRLSWHAEACARLVAECAEIRPRDPDQVWRIKGSDRLSRRALAVLREIWQWREHEALRSNKPPYFILSHEATIAVAEAAAVGTQDLPWPAHLRPFRREQILVAARRGLSLSANKLPHLVKHVAVRMTEPNHHFYHELQRRRDAVAQQLRLDPSFVASRSMLVSLASDGRDHRSDLMNWQRVLLGLEPLRTTE